jgi:hypothetical protein
MISVLFYLQYSVQLDFCSSGHALAERPNVHEMKHGMMKFHGTVTAVI